MLRSVQSRREEIGISTLQKARAVDSCRTKETERCEETMSRQVNEGRRLTSGKRDREACWMEHKGADRGALRGVERGIIPAGRRGGPRHGKVAMHIVKRP